MIHMIKSNLRTTFQKDNMQINQQRILWVLTAIQINNNKSKQAQKRIYIRLFKKHKIDKIINNNLHYNIIFSVIQIG